MIGAKAVAKTPTVANPEVLLVADDDAVGLGEEVFTQQETVKLPA